MINKFKKIIYIQSKMIFLIFGSLCLLQLSCVKKEIVLKGHYSNFNSPYRQISSYKNNHQDKINELNKKIDSKQIYLYCHHKERKNLSKCYNQNLTSLLKKFDSNLKKDDLQKFLDQDYHLEKIKSDLKYINTKIYLTFAKEMKLFITNTFNKCNSTTFTSYDLKKCFGQSTKNEARHLLSFYKEHKDLNAHEILFLSDFIEEKVKTLKNEENINFIRRQRDLIKINIGLLNKNKFITQLKYNLQSQDNMDTVVFNNLCISMSKESFQKNNFNSNVSKKVYEKTIISSFCAKIIEEISISEVTSLGKAKSDLDHLYSLSIQTMEKNFNISANCNKEKNLNHCLKTNWGQILDRSLQEVFPQSKVEKLSNLKKVELDYIKNKINYNAIKIEKDIKRKIKSKI